MDDPEPTVGWAEALGPSLDNPPNPTTNGWAIYHKDKKTGKTETYVVPALQNRHKGQFELWVRGEALKAIFEVQQSNQEMGDDMMSVYLTDFTNGHFKWDDNFDGKKIKSARKSVRGALQLLYLLMVSSYRDLTEDKAFEVFSANTEATTAAYRWAMGNWQAPTTREEPVGAGASEVKLTPEEVAEVMRRRSDRQPPKTMDSTGSA